MSVYIGSGILNSPLYYMVSTLFTALYPAIHILKKICSPYQTLSTKREMPFKIELLRYLYPEASTL